MAYNCIYENGSVLNPEYTGSRICPATYNGAPLVDEFESGETVNVIEPAPNDTAVWLTLAAIFGIATLFAGRRR